MQTVIGALVLILLGCVAVLGYLKESKAASRFEKPKAWVPPVAPTPAQPVAEPPAGNNG